MNRLLLAGAALLTLARPAAAQNAGPFTPNAAPLAQNAPNPQTITVPGVDQLYALQGNNTLLAFATPQGYADLRALVRHIDGQLDIVRTDVALVEVSAERLQSLGIASGESGRLLAAYQAGKLPSSDRVRLTTREDTPIDTLLHTTFGTTLALSVVPRIGGDGLPTAELMQPAVRPETVGASGTLLVRLTGAAAGGLRLLFITPEIMPSASRHTR